MNKMTEYRVMFNAYDGKGDRQFMITTEPLEAVESKLWLSNSKCKNKGVVWLECREVEEWKKAILK